MFNIFNKFVLITLYIPDANWSILVDFFTDYVNFCESGKSMKYLYDYKDLHILFHYSKHKMSVISI